ncbi:LOW QUALITY PROTEIN: uncharacterized protein LOC112557954 [Pomacea canaliculata]|uniref:LOW QUALITY PROTEIN: uncharacterized protein LOC112557954 n=1 Tax=Pomacea canaliculata TaxID=400727 RepID=UPI000D72FE3E|nr:LOW QUALITY PROTEIN: uncharacterized protein LOC112557954 [Pomacea canaliculata]
MNLLLLPLLVVGVSSVTLHPQSHWAGGFQLQVEIPVTCELTSWKVHLTFSEDVNTIEVWAGTAEQGSSSREYIITNKEYDAVQHTGDTLSFSLVARTSGDSNPSIEATIEGCGGDSGSSGSGGNTQTQWTVAPSSGGGSAGGKDYGDALAKSILFYDAQRSGKLPANNPIHWRGDSALGDCVVGGWYDAGDHVKFGLPFGAATHILLWGLQLFKDGYQRTNQLDNMYDMIKWGLDYMLKAWNPSTKELVVQIGDGNADHSFWGRPEDMTMNRPCLKVRNPQDGGADIAGEWAAALAAGSIVFKDKDSSYASQLLTAAESLYSFAKSQHGVFNGSAPFYGSTGFKDELCEGGVWLYRATNNQQYLSQAKSYFEDEWAWGLSWDDKKIACQVLLYETTKDNTYRVDIEGFMQTWMPGGEVPYTPCGLAWRDKWGSNRLAGNAAFIAIAAAEAGINSAEYRKWGVEQINYLLGDNHHDGGCFSFEIGYGSKFPRSPHHRASSCPDMPQPCGGDRANAPGPSPQILYGGLVGGPDQSDNYNDSRQDYVMNEVALDYNAGFQSALAGIVHLIGTNNYPTTNNKCPCTSK